MKTIHIELCPVCGERSFKPFLTTRDHSVTGETFELIQCRGCSLVATQDHPTEDTIETYYSSEEYISHSDTREGLVNRLYHAVRTRMLRRKRKYVERYAVPGTLLDIGAGTGYFLQHMQQHGWSVKGMEPDAGARDIARKQFNLQLEESLNPGILGAEAFDAITMWHVIEHVHDPGAYLSQIVRALKPHGILLIAVPNYQAFDARHYQSFWAAYDVPRHLWHFTPAAMEKLLSSHMMSVVRTYPMWFDAFYVSMLSEKYRGTSLGLLRGGLTGAYSNLRALFNRKKASSVIYIAKHRG